MSDKQYAGIVYDLDGTLLTLAVNWEAVADDVIQVYADAGIDAAGASLWSLLEDADDHGITADVEAAISRHEREGARRSRRCGLADELAKQTVPVGVCSLNCEAACRIALETHGLADDVATVVGRDSVATHKPDPEPLLATLEDLGVEPTNALFVGDSPRDKETAERAGVAFEYV
ncbi:HAD family hydrolase [Halonotius aquaticus]|uniref:HAD family hydrolase n=1 Tax=Halonotius aquaticus TaxID=2216978 RepID=A0A3A6PPX0_9EURY|nr:HAD-IA family hydrolase [Halonotius aquaticus]RJX43756.1 HAD family hydrolase [Halonotius aquaticus]